MVPSGNMGVFDPTEIHNRGQLKSHMKEAMIKLGFHLLCFFMYLYRLVSKIAPRQSASYFYLLYSASSVTTGICKCFIFLHLAKPQ